MILAALAAPPGFQKELPKNNKTNNPITHKQLQFQIQVAVTAANRIFVDGHPTTVNGIYDADPLKNPKANMFDRLTYFDVLQKGLRVMDTTAISLCMDNPLPIIVYNLTQKGNLKRIVTGQKVGTKVEEE
jgi:uridylate kinase